MNITPSVLATMPNLLEKILVAATGYFIVFSSLLFEGYLIQLDRELQKRKWKNLFGGDL